MATAFESGYGAFLPKHQNEMVQREALRGQMVKEASYLTEMDKVYAELDEMARQFDTGLASKESQFSRKLEFEYESLEQQAEQFDQSLQLQWYGAQTQRTAAEAQSATQSRQLDLAEDRFEFDQDEAAAQRDFGESQLDLISDIYDQMGSSQMANMVQPTGTGAGTSQTADLPQTMTRSQKIASKSGQVFSPGSNSYTGDVSRYDYNPDSDQFEPA